MKNALNKINENSGKMDYSIYDLKNFLLLAVPVLKILVMTFSKEPSTHIILLTHTHTHNFETNVSHRNHS